MATLTGGTKMQEVLKQIGSDAAGGLTVGFLEGATYPDGTSVAQVAFWNEFGHGGNFPAPPRPFFRKMIAEESSGWSVKLSKALKHYDYDAGMALRAMGEDIKGALQQSISTIDGPALSPTTLILRKKFGNNPQDITLSDVLQAQRDVADGQTGASGTQGKPLVWTGHLLNSVDYEVKQ